jgi:hypothetical protein
MSVKLTINNCGECPHREVARFYTADSWEHVMTWFCNKTDRPKPAMTDKQKHVENSSRIALVEWSRDEPKEIPEWCPLR